MSPRAGDWVDVCAVDDVPAPGARRFRVGTTTVALLRPDGERVFALEDRCPHKGGPLSEGIVHGTSVTCPLHNWVFDLATGLAQGADEGRVPTYAAKVEGGRIFLDATLIARATAA